MLTSEAEGTTSICLAPPATAPEPPCKGHSLSSGATSLVAEGGIFFSTLPYCVSAGDSEEVCVTGRDCSCL